MYFMKKCWFFRFWSCNVKDKLFEIVVSNIWLVFEIFLLVKYSLYIGNFRKLMVFMGWGYNKKG